MNELAAESLSLNSEGEEKEADRFRSRGSGFLFYLVPSQLRIC